MKNLKRKKLPIFKIRCSAIGQIMSNPQWWTPREKYEKKLAELQEEQTKYDQMKTKDGKRWIAKLEKLEKIREELVELEKEKDTVVLSDTTKSYVETWLKEKLYWRRKILKTGAIEKGIECEVEAIELVNKALNKNFVKSKYGKGERMEDEHFTGHEDVDDTDLKETRDTKVCFSYDTFPLIKDIKEKAYERQWQWYMALKWPEYKKHHIAKCAVNTPAHQIQQQLFYIKQRLDRKYNGNEEYIADEYLVEARQYFLQNVFDKQVVVYADWEPLVLSDDEVIPPYDRVRVCTVDRDDEAIQSVRDRVEEIRDYIRQLWYEFIRGA